MDGPIHEVIKTGEAENGRQFERTANSVVLGREKLMSVRDISIFQRVSQGLMSLPAVNNGCKQPCETLTSRKRLMQGGSF